MVERDLGGRVKDRAAAADPSAVGLVEAQPGGFQVSTYDERLRQIGRQLIAPQCGQLGDPIRGGLRRAAHQGDDPATAGHQVAQEIAAQEPRGAGQQNVTAGRHSFAILWSLAAVRRNGSGGAPSIRESR